MILTKLDKKVWTALVCSELVVGSCETCSEPLGSIKFWEFHDYLSNYWLLKKIPLMVSAMIHKFL